MRLSGAVTYEEQAAVRGLPAGHRVPVSDLGTWKELSSNGVTVYTVRQHGDGTWSCRDEDAKVLCPGYRYRGHCRHIGKVRREQRRG